MTGQGSSWGPIARQKAKGTLAMTVSPSASLWPERPSPLRRRLTDFSRAYRVAQRLFEQYGEPVAILEQASPIQAHCVVWGPEIYALKLHHSGPDAYTLITTVF